MIKLKPLLLGFAAFCIVTSLTVVTLITLVDPNRFKETLTRKISDRTGYHFAIQGPIFWQFDPSLSLEAHHVSLTNHLNTGESITVQKVRLEPRLRSLLSGNLWFDLAVDGLNVKLNRDIPDWKNIPLFYFIPHNISVSNASIRWQDSFTQKQIEVQDLNCSIARLRSGLRGSEVPMTASFKLENAQKEEIYSFAVNAKWFLNSKVKGSEVLSIPDIQLTFHLNHLPSTTMKGQLTIDALKSNPIAEGRLKILNLNIQALAKSFELPVASLLTSSAEITTAFKFQSPRLDISTLNLSLENNGSIDSSLKFLFESQSFKILHLTGMLQGKKILLGEFPIIEMNTHIEFKEDVLGFTDMKADFGHSLHQGKLKIDLRSPVPQLYLFDQISSLEVNEWLSLVGKKNNVYGRLQAEASLSTHGKTLEEWRDNLFGKAHLLLTDGKIQGIELSPLLQHAQSTVASISESFQKKEHPNVAAILTAELGEWKQQALGLQPLVTYFQLLETDLTLENGRIQTPDFKLLHPEYSVTGHGGINLKNQEAEYQALALLKNKTNTVSLSKRIATYLKETPLPIHIHGHLSNLSLQPDLARYADNALKGERKHFSKEPQIQIPPADMMPEGGLEKLFGLP